MRCMFVYDFLELQNWNAYQDPLRANTPLPPTSALMKSTPMGET
jgi:hypothetical protein